MNAGYSQTSLQQKLGIIKVNIAIILDQPKDYLTMLGILPDSLSLQYSLSKNAAFIHFFAHDTQSLHDTFPQLVRSLAKSGTLWISWMKNKQSDLNENIVREAGLRYGLVDVKVIAIDAKWSGLKFVYRKNDR